MRTSPCFIALEGIDGSGTTTQTRRLAALLRNAGREVVETAEPSQGIIGKQCRVALTEGVPLTDAVLALMFAADRLDHLHRVIQPALARNAVVVCDRYLLSTLAYQGLTLPVDWLLHINAQCLPAKLTVLLDVPQKVSEQRLKARGGPTERFDAAPLQKQIAERYRVLKDESHPCLGPVAVVDASGSIEAVQQSIWQHVALMLERPEVGDDRDSCSNQQVALSPPENPSSGKTPQS